MRADQSATGWFAVNQPVWITCAESGDLPVPGTLTEVSSRAVRIDVERVLQPGSFVEVWWGSRLLLCQIRSRSREFRVQMRVLEAL
ncbi:MAG: hypothetical protein HY013_07105 [Candidatus Solibacter usitatus]|nr:hypothetical protein [Candidatus Solibacter usitatus]